LALDGRVEPGHDDERPSHDTEKGRKLRALRIYAVALNGKATFSCSKAGLEGFN